MVSPLEHPDKKAEFAPVASITNKAKTQKSTIQLSLFTTLPAEPIAQKPLALEESFLLFPRCEYSCQYEATSHFLMPDREHHATYFRSTGRGGVSARFTQKDIASKTFENTQLNQPKEKLSRSNLSNYHGHTGTFRSPFEFKKYQDAFINAVNRLPQNELTPEQDVNATKLYDGILHYKNRWCQRVAQRFKTRYPILADEITVYHHNNCPCIMVSLSFIQDSSEKQSWNQLLIAYFIAITNKTAEDLRVPMELVHRSGFGYHLPTIDITGASFRINTGLVPLIYIEVLVQSLGKIFRSLIPLYKKNLLIIR